MSTITAQFVIYANSENIKVKKLAFFYLKKEGINYTHTHTQNCQQLNIHECHTGDSVLLSEMIKNGKQAENKANQTDEMK